MIKSPTLHSQVVEVTTDYLGPAAERFINRQIASHLKKSPENLTQRDLKGLIDWIAAVVALLSDDEDLLSEYTERLELLVSEK